MNARVLCSLCAITTATHAAPGDVEAGFNPNVNGGTVAVLTQPDGRVLVGGNFTALGGDSFPFIGRTSPAGVPEAGFRPNASDDIQSIVVLPNGQVLLAGFFITMGGVSRGRMARVTADGALDTSFIASANGAVRNLELQSDGHILAGGAYTTMNGTARSNFARLLPGGSLDLSFNPAPNDAVRVSAVQPDGKILLGGEFTAVAGASRSLVARLHANGTLDTGFDPAVSGSGVYAMALQPDGKIVIGGDFTSVRGVSRASVARLNADGTLDAGFNPGANDVVRSFAVQTDGSMVVGGTFTMFGGSIRNRVAKVNAAGALLSFNPDVNGITHSVMLQADGKVLVGGEFTTAGGVTRNRLVRLENDPATQTLTVSSPARIQWLRGGASPETHRVTFEYAPAGGSAWTPLGTGARTAGGWELSGLTLPAEGQVRARARINGSYGNGSSSLVETVAAYSLPTPLEEWRDEFFDTMENTGPAANNADPDKDGLENLVEFAFGLNPNTPDAAALPEWELEDDDYSLTCTRPPGVDGITYVAEYSTSMAPGSWTPALNVSTPPAYHFLVPAIAQRQYVRVRVTAP